MLHTIMTSYLLAELLSSSLFPSAKVLSAHNMRLDNRYPNQQVNQVFKTNILLTLNFINDHKDSNKVEFMLGPGETFAFHDNVLSKYSGKVTKTTGAHFNYADGFLSDGYLMGDGVCHLASLINWVAQDAGLLVEAPVSHDFANIPDVPREYGTSIYFTPNGGNSSQLQNLYVTNNKDYPVIFRFNNFQDNLVLDLIKMD